MYTRLDKKLLREVLAATLFFPLIIVAAITALQIEYGYIASWYVTICTALVGMTLLIGGAYINYKGDDFSRAAISLFGSSGVFIALIVHTILQDDTFFLNQETQVVIIVLAIVFSLIAYNTGRIAARYYAFKFLFTLHEKHIRALEMLSTETIVIALLLVTYFLFIS